MRLKAVRNQGSSMFNKGDCATVNVPGSPNHGASVVVCEATGWNPVTDTLGDPDYRICEILDGPNIGKVGTIEVAHLSVVLNG